MFKCWNCGTEHEGLASIDADVRYTEADMEYAYQQGYDVGYTLGMIEADEN